MMTTEEEEVETPADTRTNVNNEIKNTSCVIITVLLIFLG
jgi:hypothetical protein